MQSYGIKVDRGSNDPPLSWCFKNEEDDSLFDLTGSRLILSIGDLGQTLLRKDTQLDPSQAVIDVAAAILTVTLTPAESRLVPLGRRAYYEIERWIDGGTQGLLVGGYCEGVGGINND